MEEKRGRKLTEKLIPLLPWYCTAILYRVSRKNNRWSYCPFAALLPYFLSLFLLLLFFLQWRKNEAENTAHQAKEKNNNIKREIQIKRDSQ